MTKKLNLNKTEDLILKFAEIKGIKKTEAKEDLKMFVQAIQDLILDEEHDGLDIFGLVKFEVKEAPERMGRNPQTSEPMLIEKHNQIKAKVSKRIKDLIK